MVHEHGPEEALDRLLTGKDLRLDLSRYNDGRHRDLRQWAADTVRRAKRLRARIAIPEDDEWPAQMNDLTVVSDQPVGPHWLPPLCLWVRGRTPLAEALHRSVAVVGSRFASPYGVNIATELGRGLAEHGLTVVSGAAYGIDAAAHRGALAGNGRSVALLGSGIDVASPPSHESLFARICDHGLLVSEWPPGCSGIRRRFALANRLIASAGRGVVMVEGTVHSQALMTLAHAHRLGRRTMAIPGPVTSPASAGCHHALRDYIGVRLVTGAVQVVQELNATVLTPR
jgi:DNA processing protein